MPSPLPLPLSSLALPPLWREKHPCLRCAVEDGRDVLRPVAPHLNQKLAMDFMLMKSRDPLCNTEAAVT